MGCGADLREEIQDESRQKPDTTVAGSSKSLASRFYQLKIRRCLTGQYRH